MKPVMKPLLLFLILPAMAQAQARDPVFPADPYGHVFEPCSHEWVDISGTTPLTFTAADIHPADDEGAATFVPDSAFAFYGRMRDAITVSTNGYLAVGDGASDDGADFRSACPLPAVPTNDAGQAGRILVLQGDLEGTAAGAGVHAQSFADCPRGEGACHIVQWQDWGYHDAPGTLTFQAVIHADGEIAFQYHTLDGDLAGLTVGAQDDRAARGVTLQCGETVTVAAGQSWCMRREVVDTILVDGFELLSR